MSSRKSSSSKSSSSKSSSSRNSSMFISTYGDKNAAEAVKQYLIQVAVIMIFISILYQGVILNYVINLEGDLCNCIRDWRHNFIKYFSAAMIGWFLIVLLLLLSGFKNEMLKHALKALSIVLYLCGIINIWCLYTYVGDLNSTNCSCAVDKQKISNNFLYIWRYVLVAGVILGLVGVILNAFH